MTANWTKTISLTSLFDWNIAIEFLLSKRFPDIGIVGLFRHKTENQITNQILDALNLSLFFLMFYTSSSYETLLVGTGFAATDLAEEITSTKSASIVFSNDLFSRGIVLSCDKRGMSFFPKWVNISTNLILNIFTEYLLSNRSGGRLLLCRNSVDTKHLGDAMTLSSSLSKLSWITY